jgi:hypothetical protein
MAFFLALAADHKRLFKFPASLDQKRPSSKQRPSCHFYIVALSPVSFLYVVLPIFRALSFRSASQAHVRP